MKRCSLVCDRVVMALVVGSTWIGMHSAQAQQAQPAQAGSPNAAPPVVLQGVVPDDSYRAPIVARLMALYGRDRIADQLATGGVTASGQWRQDVTRLLPPSIRQVSKGQITLEGQVVDIRGEVPSEAARQQVIAELTQAAGSTYTVKHALKVVVPEQVLIDQALANRTVEFEPGSAVLTPAGSKLLDEMAKALGQFKGRSFELIGHTDGHGARTRNLALSQARAEAVKAYLVGKGLVAQNLRTKGMGPDQPIANNATEEGRARNRRIEFKLVI